MEHPAWGVFAVMVLLVGCNRFFFPTRYEITVEGITARFPLRTIAYQWTDLRRFVFDDTGGFLSPRVRRSLLDEYRGISLLFPEDAEEVIQEIRNRLPAESVIREVKNKTDQATGVEAKHRPHEEPEKTDRVAGVEAKRSPQQMVQENNNEDWGFPPVNPCHSEEVLSREGGP